MEFFEGTEKLLEIWFTRRSTTNSEDSGSEGELERENSDSNFDLRNIPREELDYICSLVNCKILSCTTTRDLDSYVLSESSLFINKNRILLKTCGTTTLLYALTPIIEAAFKYSGFDSVEDLFYSRKKFMRPELQLGPHTSFEDEVNFLESFFGGGGNAFVLGSISHECWYLYTLNKPLSVHEADQTLEVIMTKLDPEVMKIFTREVSESAEDATQRSGIDTIFPNALLDGYLFDPCGYSVNAILPKGHYFTIHITPEPSCSYVSFETNAPEEDFPELIRRVLDLFRPSQFIVTCFANDNSISTSKISRKAFHFKDFSFGTYQETRVKNYNVTYAQYTKKLI